MKGKPSLMVVCYGIVAVAVFASWRGVGSMGAHALTIGFLILLCGVGWAMLGGLLTCVGKAKPRLTSRGTKMLRQGGSLAILGVASIVAIPLMNGAWMVGVARATDRAKPLIEAIRSYESKEGIAPPDLTSLVPDWIDTVPGTSLISRPDFEYDPGVERDEIGSTWELYVPCSRGLMDEDVLLFYPDGKYEGVGRRNSDG